MTGNDIIAQIVGRLKHSYDPGEARAIARAYLEDRLGFKKTGTSEIQSLPDFYAADLERLVSGEPLQYITGIQHFMGLQFKVTPAVLIPRPETEELTQWVGEMLQHDCDRIILDIGTGSGCIPVSLKLKFPASQVYATDISAEALEVARFNAESLCASVHFEKDSILDPAFEIPGGIDIIVSNPPYIPLSDKQYLADHVVHHEPHLALFAPGNDPVVYYKAICRFAEKHLKQDGVIYFEVYPETSLEVVNHLEITGFKNITTRMDLSGKPRFLRASRQP